MRIGPVAALLASSFGSLARDVFGDSPQGRQRWQTLQLPRELKVGDRQRLGIQRLTPNITNEQEASPPTANHRLNTSTKLEMN